MAFETINSKLELKCNLLEDKIGQGGTTRDLLTESLADTKREIERVKVKQVEIRQTKREDDVEEPGNKPDFLSCLPDEMWEVILGNLNFGDSIRCTRASPRFDRILAPVKPVFLFKDVFPFVKKFLHPKNIVSCRRVCHDWKTSVDEYFEDNTIWHKKFIQWEAMAVYSNRFKNDAIANPFVGTAVEFDDFWAWTPRLANGGNPAAGGQTFWGTMVEFLTIHGNHIRECHLRTCFCGHDDSGRIDYVQRVGACLQRLQNVKTLTLEGILFGRTVRRSVVMRQLQVINANLEPNLLPEMPHLVHLVLDLAPGHIAKLTVFKYSEQLHSLVLTSLDYKTLVMGPSSHGELSLDLPNLTSFSISVNAEWEKVPNLVLLRCPCLATFKIQIGYDCKIVNFIDILKAIQRFRESLQHVEVEFKRLKKQVLYRLRKQSNSRIKNASVDFSIPYLKTLKLENVFESFDFLIRFPFLENLSLTLTVPPKFPSTFLSVIREDQVCEIHGFLNRMYESNVWILLPSLKEFIISVELVEDWEIKVEPNVYRYTREGYEYSKKMNSVN